ncbi:ring finger protein-related [Anaeramoeba ignava]|uniref:Ring finger protein-related n=1 Tax=Anaeramoeba ignava TaxID=1746090 RepID=A0A9Q0LMB2_ANAIG|nr:ring finger protein-related [Anaeramoeba ignava]
METSINNQIQKNLNDPLPNQYFQNEKQNEIEQKQKEAGQIIANSLQQIIEQSNDFSPQNQSLFQNQNDQHPPTPPNYDLLKVNDLLLLHGFSSIPKDNFEEQSKNILIQKILSILKSLENLKSKNQNLINQNNYLSIEVGLLKEGNQKYSEEYQKLRTRNQELEDIIYSLKNENSLLCEKLESFDPQKSNQNQNENQNENENQIQNQNQNQNKNQNKNQNQNQKSKSSQIIHLQSELKSLINEQQLIEKKLTKTFQNLQDSLPKIQNKVENENQFENEKILDSISSKLGISDYSIIESKIDEILTQKSKPNHSYSSKLSFSNFEQSYSSNQIINHLKNLFKIGSDCDIIPKINQLFLETQQADNQIYQLQKILDLGTDSSFDDCLMKLYDIIYNYKFN